MKHKPKHRAAERSKADRKPGPAPENRPLPDEAFDPEQVENDFDLLDAFSSTASDPSTWESADADPATDSLHFFDEPHEGGYPVDPPEDGNSYFDEFHEGGYPANPPEDGNSYFDEFHKGDHPTDTLEDGNSFFDESREGVYPADTPKETNSLFTQRSGPMYSRPSVEKENGETEPDLYPRGDLPGGATPYAHPQKRHRTNLLFFAMPLLICALLMGGIYLFDIFPPAGKLQRTDNGTTLPADSQNGENPAAGAWDIQSRAFQSAGLRPDQIIYDDTQIRLDAIARNLLDQGAVAVVVHPKNVGTDTIKRVTEKVIGDLEGTGKFLDYFAKLDQKEKIIAQYAVGIRHRQIDFRVGEQAELRKATGLPPLSAAETKIARDKIQEAFVDTVTLGFAGIAAAVPTDMELNAAIAQAGKSFKSREDYDAWIADLYGTHDNYRRWMRLESAAARYLEEKRQTHARPGEDEMRRYFEKHRHLFEKPESAEIRQIFIKAAGSDPALRTRLKNKLENISAKLKNDKGFDPISAAAGEGLQDWRGIIQRGDLPLKMDQTVFRLQKGQVSPVLETKRGLYLFHVLRRYPGKIPFEQAQFRIQAMQEANKLKQYLDTQLPLLRRTLEIQENQKSQDKEGVSKNISST